VLACATDENPWTASGQVRAPLAMCRGLLLLRIELSSRAPGVPSPSRSRTMAERERGSRELEPPHHPAAAFDRAKAKGGGAQIEHWRDTIERDKPSERGARPRPGVCVVSGHVRARGGLMIVLVRACTHADMPVTLTGTV
jgi:hypothetical protein